MFKKLLENVQREISGKNAKNYVSEITRYHRIQVTEEYNKAALLCKEAFEKNGIKAEILEYRSDGRTYMGFVSPEGWSIQNGLLTIDGEEYANFEREPISIIQRSTPFEGEVDLLYEEFKKDCLVFTHDFKNGKELARKNGCVGIVTDENKSRFDAPDSRQYLSFWGEKLLGFVLSPREGAKLEKQLKKGRKKAYVHIESSLFPSKMKVVSAKIEGETEEELLLIAHLCHPTPGGNDNASGVGLALEVARVLKKFKKPKRGVRILLVPEIHGTAAFISENREFLCGLNLDMVGENQFLCGSPLLIEKTPDATPFFGNHLLEAILEEVKKETTNLLGTRSYPLFMSSVTPFSGGSDHWILSDPTIDIPTPMIIHWPDKFYHTSYDTIDKVDEKELTRVGTIAATYLYFISDMDRKKAEWMARLVTQKAKQRIMEAVLGEKDIEYIVDVEKGAVESIKRVEEIELSEFKEEIERTAELEKKGVKTKKKSPKKGVVPKRTFDGPISHSKMLQDLSFEERKGFNEKMEKNKEFKGTTTLAVFWSNGERNIYEIADKIQNEIGKSSTDFLRWYFEFLEEHGLIEIVE
ncbi:MAG: DUF4910 domain-containing protein [Euryarchaeota archaeon]|nr:DUF4910 domain-containing protein [Euryarchaeota archaeon]